jgi:hypothetical protein
MMIELFGTPASGKTTFARALTVRLRELGCTVEQKLSVRPIERDPVADPGKGDGRGFRNILIRRASRPFSEILTIARHPFVNARDVITAVTLLRLLPPSNIVSSIKISQYTSRLSHSWYQLACPTKIALFDQAFVQAICSLAMLAGIDDACVIAKALDYAPKSDVLIRLDAPLALVESRLNERRRRQSAVELMFEPDLKTSLSSISIIECLHAVLLTRGRLVLRASSLNEESLNKSVNWIAETVAAMFKAEHAEHKGTPSCARMDS